MDVFSKKKLQKMRPQAPHTCHHVNQMALKWQFFPKKKLLELPSG